MGYKPDATHSGIVCTSPPGFCDSELPLRLAVFEGRLWARDFDC